MDLMRNTYLARETREFHNDDVPHNRDYIGRGKAMIIDGS